MPTPSKLVCLVPVALAGCATSLSSPDEPAASALARAPSVGWSVESDQVGSRFGGAIATGDVNGDGYDDVIVGADNYSYHDDPGSGRPVSAGRLYLYLGSASGPALTPAWTIEGGDGDALGEAVASGDVNGDGYDDVIAGARGASNPSTGEGRVYAWFGTSTVPDLAPSWIAESQTTEASPWFGSAVASGGDVNGDGYDEVAVGAKVWDNGEINEGRVFVYRGSATGPETAFSWSSEGDQEQAWYGMSVAFAGDTDGDGFDDLAVGAPLIEDPEVAEGRAELFLGSVSGLALTPSWTAEANVVSAYLGTSVAGAGDVNGDGYADLVVGAPFEATGPLTVGRARVFLGSAAGLSPTASSTIDNKLDYGNFAHAVGSAGDTNGDGYDDVVVGAPWLYQGIFEQGGAWLNLGSPAGVSPTPTWTVRSNDEALALGWSVSAGDLNGDGLSDVLLGGLDETEGYADGEGRAESYFGAAPTLTGAGSCPGSVALTLAGYTPGTEVVVARSPAPGADPIPGGPCAGAITGLAGPSSSRPRAVPPSGNLVLTPGSVPCGTHLQALDLSTCTLSDVLEL